MCGIIGYVGERIVDRVLIDGLKRLEYRGYDSAGIAVIQEGELILKRSVGKIINLEQVLARESLSAQIGLGHTRWATHGRPSEENAHPHTDCTGRIVVVHNGIIENYSSFGVATDLSILYYNEYQPYAFTLVARNIGYQITVFDQTREKLPLQIELGASYKLKNVPIAWHITFDNLQKWDISESNPSNVITDIDGNITDEEISFFDNTVRHLTLGAEIFPKGAFNIRLGYNFRRAAELRILEQRDFSGLSFGIGIKLNKMRFSYTHARYSSASNASFFGLQIDLR